MTSPPQRCVLHDLAEGPDGRCVVCRREQASGTIGRLVVGSLVALALLTGSAIWYRVTGAAEAAVVDDGLPPADLAEATQRVRITVYSTSWCPHCQHAKTWLKSGGHRFTELDVERDAAARKEQRRLSPRGGVPVIDVDGKVLEGFDPSATAEAIERAAARRLAAR